MTTPAPLAGDPAVVARVLRLRAAGELWPPMTCLPPGGGLGLSYLNLLRALDPKRPMTCLQSGYVAEPKRGMPATVESAATDYLELLRTVQPEGPYQLVGWSFGGFIAHTVACRIQQEGGTVSGLVIIDMYPHSDRDLAEADLAQRQINKPEIPMSSELLPHHFERMWQLLTHNTALSRTFKPVRAFDGDVLLITTPANRQRCDGWLEYLKGSLVIRVVESEHEHVLQKSAPAVGTILESFLAPRTERRPRQ